MLSLYSLTKRKITMSSTKETLTESEAHDHEHKHEKCLVTQILEGPDNNPENRAVLGPAHAASGAGLAAITLGFLAIAGGPAVAGLTFIKVLLTVPGGALSPDLDSNTSTARNSMGFIGAILTHFYRSTSYILQKTIRTKRDNPNPDPHRGFWHTLVGAATIGFIFYLLSSIAIPVYQGYTLGFILGSILGGTLLYIGLNGVAKKKIKKLKNIPIIGDLILWAGSIALIAVLQGTSPDPANFTWLGLSVGLGAAIHIFGDAITKKGVPVFFPITGFTKGKFWWDTRFAAYDAGDEGLNSFIFNFSMILVAVGIILYILAVFSGINLGLI